MGKVINTPNGQEVILLDKDVFEIIENRCGSELLSVLYEILEQRDLKEELEAANQELQSYEDSLNDKDRLLYDTMDTLQELEQQVLKLKKTDIQKEIKKIRMDINKEL